MCVCVCGQISATTEGQTDSGTDSSMERGNEHIVKNITMIKVALNN